MIPIIRLHIIMINIVHGVHYISLPQLYCINTIVLTSCTIIHILSYPDKVFDKMKWEDRNLLLSISDLPRLILSQIRVTKLGSVD